METNNNNKKVEDDIFGYFPQDDQYPLDVPELPEADDLEMDFDDDFCKDNEIMEEK